MASGKSTKLNIDFEKFMHKNLRKESRVVKDDLNDDKW